MFADIVCKLSLPTLQPSVIYLAVTLGRHCHYWSSGVCMCCNPAGIGPASVRARE